jgi:hypothetical protein
MAHSRIFRLSVPEVSYDRNEEVVDLMYEDWEPVPKVQEVPVDAGDCGCSPVVAEVVTEAVQEPVVEDVVAVFAQPSRRHKKGETQDVVES